MRELIDKIIQLVNYSMTEEAKHNEALKELAEIVQTEDGALKAQYLISYIDEDEILNDDRTPEELHNAVEKVTACLKLH